MSFHAVDWFTVGGSLGSAGAIFASIFVYKKQRENENNAYKKQKEREIRALKLILKKECELNYFSLEKLKGIILNLHSEKVELTLRKGNFGYNYTFNFDRVKMSGRIPIFYINVMSSSLLTAARLDDEFFSKLEVALDVVSELNHITNNIIDYTLNKDEKTKVVLRKLASYTSNRMEFFYNNLNELYIYCSGDSLTTQTKVLFK